MQSRKSGAIGAAENAAGEAFRSIVTRIRILCEQSICDSAAVTPAEAQQHPLEGRISTDKTKERRPNRRLRHRQGELDKQGMRVPLLC